MVVFQIRRIKDKAYLYRYKFYKVDPVKGGNKYTRTYYYSLKEAENAFRYVSTKQKCELVIYNFEEKGVINIDYAIDTNDFKSTIAQALVDTIIKKSQVLEEQENA